MSLATVRALTLMARQELFDRQRMHMLGPFWLLLQPLAYIALFTTVFAEFMRARLGVSSGPYDYAIYLISGLLLWTAMANSVTKLATVFTTHAGLLRKVPLGLGLFPVHVLLVEAALYLLALVCFTAWLLLIAHPPVSAWLWLPLPVLLGLLLAYAVGLMLGLLEVFLPDIRQLTPLLVQFGFWLTPIVYPPDILPAHLRPLLDWHPVWWAIGPMHDIVLGQRAPEVLPLLKLTLLVAALLLLARGLKRRLERDIRDTL